jgi:hypothetical protein
VQNVLPLLTSLALHLTIIIVGVVTSKRMSLPRPTGRAGDRP